MLDLIVASAGFLAAVWKVSQFIRAPRDPGVQVLTACTVFVAIGLIAQAIATSFQAVAGLASYVQFVVVTWFFGLLVFLLESSLHPDQLRRWGRLELAGLVASNVLVALLTARVPAGSLWRYQITGMTPEVLAVILAIDATLLYATVRGGWLAWTAFDRVPRLVGFSLRIAAFGLFWNALLDHGVRVASTGSRLLTGVSAVPSLLDANSQAAQVVGIVIFSLGITYPGIRTTTIKTRLWFRARKRCRALYPIWRPLVRAFPAIALNGEVGSYADRLGVVRMRQKYYRRVIECRDGLVHLSPYVAEPSDNAGPYTMQVQATMVRAALERRYRGDAPTGRVVTLAAPASPDGEDDAVQLLRLARAFTMIEQQR